MMTSGTGNGLSDGDVLPEMVGVFRYLTEHTQKVYHEGYFQKLNDTNPDGSAVTNREWTDCYAQLIGTVLTIWDDRAMQEEEERVRRGFPSEAGAVKPTFLNLTDASMKMIDSLPQRASGDPLQNVLSVSTAGRNRYLLHFGTPAELTQWTAAIRLSMYEHNCLQEAYTGALVAAKGRSLNSIGSILERSRFKVEDWTRVRFGAGTPWKRYWTVITPPDEKAFQKAKKAAKKATKQTGAQIRMEAVTGDIKFYETNKVKKKTPPVATINGAFAAYAVYPESKALIDQSTLIKIEGNIVIHSDPPFSSEGIIFMMPDHHAAVSGFEMLLRFLIPTYDVFNLYGRPNRLVADSIDPRSLMFAFPKEARSQYRLLETTDVAAVVSESGSTNWTEAEWRKKLKQATSKVQLSGRGLQRANLTSPSTASLPAQLKFGSSISFDAASSGERSSTNSQRPGLPTIHSYAQQAGEIESHSAPPALARQISHSRSMSEAHGSQFYSSQQQQQPAGYQPPPVPPPPPSSVGAYGGGYAPNTNYPSQQPISQSPQAYGNGQNSHPNSRPPSSRSQRSQNGQYGQSGQQLQGGPAANAYRGDPRGAGGFDPSLGGRQPPQLQTANLAPSYPMPATSPSSTRAPPAPAHSFSPVANARAMSRLSIGTLEMMHSNSAGPTPNDYHQKHQQHQQKQQQPQSPTLGFHGTLDGPAAHRTNSHGSSDSGSYSSSGDSDTAVARAYTTQGYTTAGGVTSGTSRVPKTSDIHKDYDDLNLADEFRKQHYQLEVASHGGAQPHGMYAHAPYQQDAYPPMPNVPQHGYGGQQYGNGQNGSAQSTPDPSATHIAADTHEAEPQASQPQAPPLATITDTTATTTATTIDITTYDSQRQISPEANGTPPATSTDPEDDGSGYQEHESLEEHQHLAELIYTSTPGGDESIADGISRIDSDVLQRIASIQRMDSTRTLDMSDTASNYSSEPPSPAPPPRRRDRSDSLPRTGRKKFVGQPTEEMLEVTIGEAKYVTHGRDSPPWGTSSSSSRPASGGAGAVLDHRGATIGGGGNMHGATAVGAGAGAGGAPVIATPPATPNVGSTIKLVHHGRGASVGGVDVDFGPTANLGGGLGRQQPQQAFLQQQIFLQQQSLLLQQQQQVLLQQQQQREKSPNAKRETQHLARDGIGNAGGMNRRSVAWTPGMVNFQQAPSAPSAAASSTGSGGGSSSSIKDTNTNIGSDGEASATAGATATGTQDRGRPLEKDRNSYLHNSDDGDSSFASAAQEFVSQHVAMAQHQDEIMRNRLLQQHHQQQQRSSPSPSSSQRRFLAQHSSSAAKSRSPSTERPALHSRTSSAAVVPTAAASRPTSGGYLHRASSADLLANISSSGNGAGASISRPHSRSASRELLTASLSRPQSRDLLTRPSSRGPSQLLAGNVQPAPPSSIPLHALPPPASALAPLQSLPPSSYHLPPIPLPPPPLSNAATIDRGSGNNRDSLLFGSTGKLSAAEQEHVARSTGTPLLGQTWNSKTQKKMPPHSAGLLGVMEKREREKRDFKEHVNRNSWTVQQAVRQRQSMLGMSSLLQQQEQQQQQQQQQITPPEQAQRQSMYGFYGPQPTPPTPQQMQQQYGFYSPGGQANFSSPSVANRASWAPSMQQQQQQQQQMMYMMQQQLEQQQLANQQLEADIQAQQQQRRTSWRYG
ncbi:hypothetical protein TWF696_001097 [Orbilia brochopaga]